MNNCTMQLHDFCPRCLSKIQEIAINNDETIKICPNTSCTFPFLPEDALHIKKIPVDGVQTHSYLPVLPELIVKECHNAELTSPVPTGDFDIEEFLKAQCVSIEEDNWWEEGVTEVINEILTATGTLPLNI